MLLDSGTRREFETGAVRDIQEGKGRCDLLPVDIVADLLEDSVLHDISDFIRDPQHQLYLHYAITDFAARRNWSLVDTIIEVSKHYEEGALKYGEHNWEKGIPVHCYIDSGIRHYLKYLRGDDDEPHDRAFVWNMLGAIWTCVHYPDLVDLKPNDAH